MSVATERGETPAPIIVAARFGMRDFAWLDGLRRAHFPPERNHLAAHLTLFHHLPPTAAPELVRRLKQLALRPCPDATIDGVLNLGRGVALRVRSPELVAMRQEVAAAFAGMLTPQDAAGFRPHVTVQNKVDPADARALRDHLAAGFRERPLAITGLSAHWYRGGPWEPIGAWSFRGGR